jgi:hypothetical protein
VGCSKRIGWTFHFVEDEKVRRSKMSTLKKNSQICSLTDTMANRFKLLTFLFASAILWITCEAGGLIGSANSDIPVFHQKLTSKTDMESPSTRTRRSGVHTYAVKQ